MLSKPPSPTPSLRETDEQAVKKLSPWQLDVARFWRWALLPLSCLPEVTPGVLPNVPHPALAVSKAEVLFLRRP